MSEKQVVSRHGSLMVYQDLLVATLPLLAMAVFLYGPRPALLWLAAVALCLGASVVFFWRARKQEAAYRTNRRKPKRR